MNNVIKLDPRAKKKQTQNTLPLGFRDESLKKIHIARHPNSKALMSLFKVLEIVVVVAICSYLAVSCVK
jgi:hypothetical protein